jgi:NADPH:quinone reductase-like Zn-dependent oxidoreductase
MFAALTLQYGPADVLEVREVRRPEPAADEVLVEVFATPVTAGDRRLHAADFPGVLANIAGRLMMGVTRPRNPIQGSMFAGRIVATGAGVTRWRVGDDVFGSVDGGAYAQFLTVNTDGPIASIPKNASYKEAADVPYGAVTALRFLRDFVGVEAGDHVLIVGASGGVGRYAIQVAKTLGAQVTAVAGARSQDLVGELGADHFVDYRSEDWRTNGGRYDVIFDIADATSYIEARDSLTNTGCFATLFMTLDVIWHNAKASILGGPRAVCGVALGTAEDMQTLSEWLAEGRLRATPGTSFDLADIAQAHAFAEQRGDATVMVTARRATALRAVA